MPRGLAGLCPSSSSWPLPLPTQREGSAYGLGWVGFRGLSCPNAGPPPDERTCSARLTVRPSRAPLFTRLLEDVEVPEGRAARFDCKISGTPPPSVTWTHFGTALHPADVALEDPQGQESKTPL